MKTSRCIALRNFVANFVGNSARVGVLAALSFQLASVGLRAQSVPTPPELMSYQGYLVDANGTVLGNNAPKNYDVIFRAFDASQGGTLLWAEQQTITVDKGYFSVLLGEGTKLGGDADKISGLFNTVTASDRYVEITVKGIGSPPGDVVIAPRLRLLTSPYTFLARQANYAGFATNAGSLVNAANGTILTVSGTNVNVNGGFSSGPSQINGDLQLNNGDFKMDNNHAFVARNSLGVFEPWLWPRGTDNKTYLNYGSGGFTMRNQDSSIQVMSATPGGDVTFAGAVNASYFVGSGVGLLGVPQLNRNQNFTGVNSFLATVGIGTANLSRASDTTRLLIQGDDTHKTGDASQLVIQGNSNPNRQLEIGYKTDQNYAAIQSIEQGVAVQPLVLNPAGGRVGVGVTSPRAPLEVTGSATVSSSYLQISYDGFANLLGSFVSSGNFSIIASGSILAAQMILRSDARIKKIVGQSDSQKDMDIIQRLRVTDYYPIDVVAQGRSLRKGFIAQEVKEIIPEAVSVETQFIPDLYCPPTSCTYSPSNKQLTVTLPKAHKLKSGDRIRLITSKEPLELPVVEVPSENEVVLGQCASEPTQVFVYGKEVSDFLAVNYDRIFTTGISAIQELAKRAQATQDRLAEVEQAANKMKAENASLKAALEQQSSRLAGLEKAEQDRALQMAELKTLIRQKLGTVQQASLKGTSHPGQE